MINTFIEFLETNLHDIILEPPLFYNNAIGLRFELGVPYRELEDPVYFETIHNRSIALFESIFQNSNELYIVMKTNDPLPPFEVMNTGVNVFAHYVDANVAKDVTCYEEEATADEGTNELDGYLRSYCLLCSLRDIDYKGILTAISYTDFKSKGDYISDRIFFIHPSKQIVFHMYDDRGLDMVAVRKEELDPLYTKYNEWILDYDRATIDGIFGG
jgi:hypothetical protein